MDFSRENSPELSNEKFSLKKISNDFDKLQKQIEVKKEILEEVFTRISNSNEEKKSLERQKNIKNILSMNLNHEWTTKGIFSIQFKSKIGFFERVCISIEITNILDNFDLVVDTTIWPQMTNCQWILFENSSSLITIPCLEKKSTKYLIISIPIHVFFDPKSLLLLISCCPLMENQAKLDPNIYSIISSGSNVNLPKSQTTSIEIQKPDEWNKFDWTGLEYLSENSIIEFVQFVVCSFVSRKLAKPIEINEFRQKFAPFVFFDLRSIESQFLAGIDQFFGLAIILSNKQRRWIDVIYAKDISTLNHFLLYIQKIVQ